MVAPNRSPTRRVALLTGGVTLDTWTSIEVVRDLGEISGSFRLELQDWPRANQTLPYVTPIATAIRMVKAGAAVTITFDGEPVLIGYVDEVNPEIEDGQARVTISGRDKTGDLVDCAAAPSGPCEYRGLDTTQITERICKPFGMKVEADTDVGEPFERFSIDVAETAMSAIEKMARQRQLLVVSDGVGGVKLTRTGKTRAPGGLTCPGNVIRGRGKFSVKDRYSDYHVKGQAERAAGRRDRQVPLDVTAEPLGAPATPSPTPAGNKERFGVEMAGHARDAEIERYRPTVLMPRSQSTDKSIQDQAEWAKRSARDKGEVIEYEVLDWRIAGKLWRPNWLVPIEDNYQDVHRDMLLAGVTFTYSEDGERTKLRMTSPESSDMDADGDRRRNRKSQGKRKSKRSGPLDGTASAL